MQVAELSSGRPLRVCCYHLARKNLTLKPRMKPLSGFTYPRPSWAQSGGFRDCLVIHDPIAFRSNNGVSSCTSAGSSSFGTCNVPRKISDFADGLRDQNNMSTVTPARNTAIGPAMHTRPLGRSAVIVLSLEESSKSGISLPIIDITFLDQFLSMNRDSQAKRVLW
jgi:hypothetical protein